MKSRVDMNVAIAIRPLRESEVTSIVNDIRAFPDLAYVKPALLRSFRTVYVVDVGGEFAGMCAVEEFQGIRKLGPIAIRERFQKSGIGRLLMKRVFEDSLGTKTYFGSSNERVKDFARKFGCVELGSIWKTPWEIKKTVFHYLCEYFSLRYIFEVVRKKAKYGRGSYVLFSFS